MLVHRRGFLTGAAAIGLDALLLGPAHAAGKSLPFPELTVSGSPGAMGRSHGRAFAAQIRRNIRFYLRWLCAATGKKPEQLLAVAHSFAAVLRRHHPDLLEEMAGIARGANRTLDEILAVNARTDMLVMGQRPSQPGTKGAVPGCTALAISGGSKKRRLLALGQNWDWRSELAQGTVILRVKPAKGPRLVTFTEAGMVGKIGFNEHGLGVCLNFLSHRSEDPRGEFGIPVHCLLRAVMGCESLEQAYKMVAWSTRCASANFLMAQHTAGTTTALDLEWTPTAVARAPFNRGLLVHTNHYKDPALALGCASGRGKSTMNRDRTAHKRARELQQKIADPVERMKQILATRAGAPYSVSKTSAPDSPSQTLAGIVMDLSRDKLHICAGPPHQSRWAVRPGLPK